MRTEQLGDITLIQGDCLTFMATLPDKAFDLAIVDPPYGLGDKLAHNGNGKNTQSKFSDEFKSKAWDQTPPYEYFTELFRVSHNQIIWGGNYFNLSPNRGFIVWDKMVYIPSMSQIEQAWTSFDRLPLLVKINNNDANRIHLTQKPVQLYKWLLKNYAKPTDTILDTHGGSFSSAIAAHDGHFKFTGIELDEEYFESALKRIRYHQRQTNLF